MIVAVDGAGEVYTRPADPTDPPGRSCRRGLPTLPSSRRRRSADSVDISGPQTEADRLAGALANGGRLEPRVIDGVPLAAGEVAYGDLAATGWRYFGLQHALYEKRTILVGGPLLMMATGLASAVGNRRARLAAEAAAAPQWRPLGSLRIVLSSERLLVWHRQAWWSVWRSGITDLHPYPEHQTLDLFFQTDPPYRLAGPDVVPLGVVLAQAVPSLCRPV